MDVVAEEELDEEDPELPIVAGDSGTSRERSHACQSCCAVNLARFSGPFFK